MFYALDTMSAGLSLYVYIEVKGNMYRCFVKMSPLTRPL